MNPRDVAIFLGHLLNRKPAGELPYEATGTSSCDRITTVI